MGSFRTRGSELVRAGLTIHGMRVKMRMASACVRSGMEDAGRAGEKGRRVRAGGEAAGEKKKETGKRGEGGRTAGKRAAGRRRGAGQATQQREAQSEKKMREARKKGREEEEGQ